MCGIFGIYTNQVKKINKKYILQDLNLFSKLSLSRGQDTFGVVFSKDQKEYVYKVNTHPIKALKRKDFENFIDPVFKNFDDTKYFSAIGQTRLVTNGSKFLSENNQPIVTTNIIGVHNGIIIEKDKNTLLRQNQEGYNIKSDSLVFFENLNRFFLESKDNFFEKYINYLNNTDGNYSIAFRIPYLKLNFLSSNCGSLYYFSSDEYFIFASEKNILEDFIAKSKFKINFQKQKIKKILNEQVIFDDNLKIININEILEKKINIQNKNFKIYDNISQEIYRRDNLVKCSKCILPSTYPFIKFDEKGVSNYFKKYKKQEFLGEQKLFEVLENIDQKMVNQIV